MLNVKRFVVGLVRTNSYLAYKDGSNEAILFDPGRGFDKIQRYAENIGVKVVAVLLTHGHFDHILEAKKWQDSGVKVYVGEADQDKLFSKNNLGNMVGLTVPFLNADYTLTDNEELTIAGLNIKVLATPGHSKGSVCYIIDDTIFSGDTLFAGDYGRTDFYDSDHTEMLASLRRLFDIDGDYKVLPGHGESTTLDIERRTNIAVSEL